MAFWDVSLTLVIILSYCLHILLTRDQEWQLLTNEHIGKSIFSFINDELLLSWRLVCLITVWSVIYMIYNDKEGFVATLRMRDGSKKTIVLRQTERFGMFTVWSWMLQGVYFLLSAYSTLSIINPDVVPTLPASLQKITWIIFEISFPIAFLVSSVVTYVLIPVAKMEKLPISFFFKPAALIMHTVNVFFMVVEFIINRHHFAFYHFPYIIFYAASYVLFAWIWHYYRGVFYYFFLDYELKGAIAWYLGLLGTMLVFFMGGYYASLLQHSDHKTFVDITLLTLAFLAMKFEE